ncbi:MAG: tyrosine-type recombinase/integrase [Sphingobacteriaceae bacterium]
MIKGEASIQAMLTYLKKQLDNGFDPFFPEIEDQYRNAIEKKKEEIEEADRAGDWNLEFGLKLFIENCRERNLSENTIKTYNTYVRNFEDWLRNNELMYTKCASVDETFARRFLNESYEGNKWSPRTYNNHLNFLMVFFARVQKLEKRQNHNVNYMLDLTDLEEKKTRAEKNRYYTGAVAEKVKKELKKDAIMYNYVKWLFYSCMRPKEIRLLQIKNIDIHTRQIKATAPTAKTGDRYIPICDELADLIKGMKLDELPLDFYVFGEKGVSSFEIASRDYYTKRYKPIKDKLGLDDKYSLYGWKHTRVVNLLIAGFNDQEVMSLTGHTDYQSYLAYKRELMVDSSKMKGRTVAL